MDELDVLGEAPGVAETEEPLTRAGRRDQQVQRILEAAEKCFVRSGFQGASMQQICSEAGMSPGALYRYFPSKEAIIEAICEADRAEDVKLFAKVLQNPSVVEGIVTGAMAHMRQMHETKAAPLFAEIMAESKRNDIVGVTCLENKQAVEEIIRGYLAGGIERGEIDPVAELDVLLPSMMAIAHGMALNDLPSFGIPFEKLEPVVRATVEGLLRPTGRSATA